MKKLLFVALFLCNLSLLSAQDMGDAVRYSSDKLNGTARFISMGGAFNALGGDISALKSNPAGSAVFLTNQGSVSLDVLGYKNSTDYADGHDSYHNNNFDLNQAGMVFVFNNTNENATISRLSFGVAYDRTNSYKNRFTAAGQSNETVSDRFMNFAQGVPLNLFTPMGNESLDDLYNYLGYADEGFNNNRLQTAYLGYETYLFDAIDGSDMNNTGYTSNVSGNSFDHVYHNYARGSNGKLTFNGGLALKDKFYFGLNLNSHFIDYRRHTIINEYIPQPSEINEINFSNYLDTKGSGFSFQVGGIARLGDMMRVSVAYESPTWYKISDETTQFLRTDSEEFGEAIANPNVTNVYPDYHYRTPGKISAGLAAVFGNSGLLSFEYSYRDFSNIKYTSSGFGGLNDNINNLLQGVSTYRIGGEYRIKNFSLRGGFRYEDSPYKNGNIVGDLHGYSAGLGYDFGGMKLDFAYDLAKRDYNNPLLNTGFSQRASIKNTLSHYVLTLVLPF